MASQPSGFVLPPPQGKDRYFPGDLPSLIDRKVHLRFSGFSGKYLGAVGLGSSGIAYLGITVEFPVLPLRYSIDAEKFLVANLALHSEPNLTHLALSEDGTNFIAPCEHCLLFLENIDGQPNILITNRVKEHVYVDFPHVSQLAVPESAYLLQVLDNELTLLDAYGEDTHGDMKRTALAAANRSFSPHKKCPSGVALKDCNQKVYRGWYMESLGTCASLGPAQAALVDFIIKGGTEFKDIVEAVLVEKKDANESHVVDARELLTKIAPECDFTVYHCV